MPIVDHQTYCALLDKALAEHYALPAINVLQIDTLNAAIEGFAEAQSDGIIQITPSAGECTAGNLNDAYLGAVTLAVLQYLPEVLKRSGGEVALQA